MLRASVSRAGYSRLFSTSCISRGKVIENYSKVPEPTKEVPDVQTFLTKIGRDSIQHEKHFESWEELMTKPSSALKEAGVEARERRYILQWRERFKQGIPLMDHKRGGKKWGGERNAKANKAVFYGRQRSEEREKQQNGN
ncbi:small ribosomal subunit protein mS41 [Trichomonascus vanleenenianus]|uniref:mitochondrial 37S ribosomal protein mS41 FYV4 n=1 Tax=Trichomonascus vanleenenianus TaxID=2268995 RepID=UPI003ECA9D28